MRQHALLRHLVPLAAALAILAPALANGDEPRKSRLLAGHDSEPRDRPGAAPAPKPPEPPTQIFDSSRLEGTGALLLADIMKLVRQSSRLADEVASALDETKVVSQDVVCIGRRMDGRWRYLAGARVQPYVCRIGNRWLELTAELRVLGRRGESYQTVSEVAAANARTISETNPRWNWTSERPREWLLE